MTLGSRSECQGDGEGNCAWRQGGDGLELLGMANATVLDCIEGSDAIAEIERLQSEAADLQHTKFDRGLSNFSPTRTASATDWFKNFLKRKQVLTGEIKATERHAD